MKLIKCLFIAAMLLATSTAQAGKVTIAAAADLKFAMDEIITHFRVEHPKDQIEVIYGSSGKFHTQIQQGAPYDLYFSADIAFAESLFQAGHAASPVIRYALGRIVLWSSSLDASKLTLDSLTDPNITRIAIANPKHAPYGKRAEEALRARQIWNKIEHKLIFGENIAHTAQFVETGNAQIGVIALALALNPTLTSKGGYWLIPDNLHEPLEQGFIITKRAGNNTTAKRFAAYINSKASRTTLTKYGFVLPDEGKNN